MDINTINSIVKIFCLTIFTDLIANKLVNREYTRMQLGIYFGMSLILSIIYGIYKSYLNTTIAVLIIYIITCCLLKILNKYRFGYSMLVGVISIALCLITYFIAVMFSFIPYLVIYQILHMKIHVINSVVNAIIQGIIIISIFKIKKLKNGLDFLKNKNQNDYIDTIMLIISSIIVIIYLLFGNYYGDKLTIHIFISMMSLIIIMTVLIEKSLELCYKQNLLKKELNDYKEELEKKNNEIKKLSEERYEISRINHEFYNRQKALEMKVKELVIETSDEIGILDRIENLNKEYSKSLEEIKGKQNLPLTNIPEIDDMFKYMQSECYKSNIEFKLHIEGEIYHLVNEIIPKNKLETMIGDHIRNAIIAINSSRNKNRSILVILGIKDKCYELCIYDSGIEFEIETLKKLGVERATTHKETCGSGIGFMTTFETLRECKASLIIEEKHEMREDDYTKAVKIRFDGKNEYKIQSYRLEKIQKTCKEKRIILENLKKESRKNINTSNINNNSINVNFNNNNKNTEQ